MFKILETYFIISRSCMYIEVQVLLISVFISENVLLGEVCVWIYASNSVFCVIPILRPHEECVVIVY